MKKIILAAALLMAASVFGYRAQAQEMDCRKVNYIEVSGKAEKEITPDEIYLQIIINEKDYKNRTLSEVEKSMLRELSKLKIDVKKDLAIKDIASNFKKYFIKGNDPKLSKEYQLLVHDARTTGQVILAMENAGISRISIDRVENSRIEEYKNEVKIEAMKNAKSKAELLTGAIGQKIGKAIYINEQEGYYNRFNDRFTVKAYGLSMDNAEASVIEEVPDIAFENIKLETSVQVRFELW